MKNMPSKARRKEDDILHKLKLTGKTLRAARTKKDVLDLTLKLFDKLDFDRVRIWLLDEEKNTLRCVRCNYNASKKLFQASLDPHVTKDSSMLVRGLASHKPFINKKNATLHKISDDTNRTLTFPMLAGKQTLGAISVDNTPSGRPLSLKKYESAVSPFVNHVALVLHRVITDDELKKANQTLQKEVAKATRELEEKNKELEYIAHHDALTDLPNRRGFDDELARQCAKATKKKPIACAMMDVDYLKHINDTKGHIEGDRILQQIAAVLKRQKSLSFAARYAGDEFVMLAPGLVHPNGYRRFERIQRAIYKATGQNVCIGVSDYPSPHVKTTVDLIRMADDALYHAKHLGRKKVVCCDDENMNIVPAAKRKKKLQNIEKRGTIVTDYIDQLEVLNDISTILQKAVKRSEIMHGVLRTFRNKIGFERVRLHLIEPNSQQLTCAYAVGIPKNMWHILDRDLEKNNSLATNVFQHGKIIDVKSQSEYKKFNPNIPGILGTKAALAIPLIAKRKRTVGVLIADYNPEKLQFDTKNQNFFLALGQHIALALDQAQLFTEVHDLNRDLSSKVKEATSQLMHYSQSLEHKIEDNRVLREEERRTHFEIISALVFSIESKDVYTRGHSTRVANYAYQIGKLAKLSSDELIDLRYGALLHDIGKLSVDQGVLHKNEPLTDEEAKHLSNHPEIGYKIVSSMRFLYKASTFVRHHHERWDGNGYPLGLQGDDIPLGARIINIADSLDAMITHRSYGKKLKIADAIAELEAGAGTQFDPALAKVLIAALKKGKFSIAK